MPAVKVKGKTVAESAAFKNHLSYVPHSGAPCPRSVTSTGTVPDRRHGRRMRAQESRFRWVDSRTSTLCG